MRENQSKSKLNHDCECTPWHRSKFKVYKLAHNAKFCISEATFTLENPAVKGIVKAAKTLETFLMVLAAGFPSRPS